MLYGLDCFVMALLFVGGRGCSGGVRVVGLDTVRED